MFYSFLRFRLNLWSRSLKKLMKNEASYKSKNVKSNSSIMSWKTTMMLKWVPNWKGSFVKIWSVTRPYLLMLKLSLIIWRLMSLTRAIWSSWKLKYVLIRNIKLPWHISLVGTYDIFVKFVLWVLISSKIQLTLLLMTSTQGTGEIDSLWQWSFGMIEVLTRPVNEVHCNWSRFILVNANSKFTINYIYFSWKSLNIHALLLSKQERLWNLKLKICKLN